MDGDFKIREGRARVSGSDQSPGDEAFGGPFMADTMSEESEFWAYSGTEMKKTYYQAFWRARSVTITGETRANRIDTGQDQSRGEHGSSLYRHS